MTDSNDQTWGVILALDVPSTLNRREHWRPRQARTRLQRSTVYYGLRAAFGLCPFFLPVEVTLVRLGPRLLDDDNVVTALKAVRDGCADYTIGAYGQGQDGSSAMRWVYGQRRFDVPGVEITFRALD
jgi:hypothetical protein